MIPIEAYIDVSQIYGAYSTVSIAFKNIQRGQQEDRKKKHRSQRVDKNTSTRTRQTMIMEAETKPQIDTKKWTKKLSQKHREQGAQQV